MAASTILTVNNLSKMFITETIFSGVSFQVMEREKVALVGVNGAGKSTILRILAGVEYANSGEIIKASGLRMTYLSQEARFTSNGTVLDEAREAFKPVLEAGERMREIEREMETADDLDALLEEYDRLQTRFELGGDKETSYMYELGYAPQYHAANVAGWAAEIKIEACELFDLLALLISKRFVPTIRAKADLVK